MEHKRGQPFEAGVCVRKGRRKAAGWEDVLVWEHLAVAVSAESVLKPLTARQ